MLLVRARGHLDLLWYEKAYNCSMEKGHRHLQEVDGSLTFIDKS